MSHATITIDGHTVTVTGPDAVGMAERLGRAQSLPAGARIHTAVTSCDDCPACVYESDSRYSCERAGYRKFEQRGATHSAPEWCPLPLTSALQPETVPLTHEHVRAVGGIVHRDGNIFFTNIEKLNAAVEAAKPA
jgi:hypothetical protein